MYAESLVTRGTVTKDELTKETTDYTIFLNEELKQSDNAVPLTTHLGGHWKGLVQASEEKITIWDTGICTGRLLQILVSLQQESQHYI